MPIVFILLVGLVFSPVFMLGMYSFELRDGAVVRGELIQERVDRYYVDLGFDLIEIPKGAVVSAREVDVDAEELLDVANDERIYRMLGRGADRSIRDWVDQIGEAVALVETPTGLGSGFVIHKDGYLVTNDHVVAGEHRIAVTIFERGAREMKRARYESVRIVAISSDLDLALLKIESDGAEPFTTVPIAAADSALHEGQTVFAIGSPLGLDRTVSEGIISVANRVINGRLYLQTTTQINPGNSGGPLFNLKGEVVGVNNMKIAAVGAEGLGFSISSRVLKTFLDNRDAYAFDPRNPNSGFRYISPPKMGE
ncbi:S1C family serine protease [Coraliomargarita akajimensis]|uniref:Peptidase S1 and S6 chymotrypsin/Hap n=1 Tax=Coraliomargarita akajimensis (strain DSM 45221 / IAM 15411 / JCM 23193 / KCTC 12865 / 04OKA010-24) TaxID=583355 RepID=D5EQE2_CORAD|nr:trypsin-like peptidase domain-containing protein [Coraliomargarita akajimensis]ADE53910.1 peptidase S1 and S6 chymotrypsin/Hap [Coraliomargarita akajimensis DSM 45221]